MLLKGRHNEAIVYTEVLDEKASEQIVTLCDQDFVKGSRIRIMPDVHAGAGCTIGTTMTIEDKVVPNLVGVDIGCGVEVVRLAEKGMDFARLDSFIRRSIPSGRDVRKQPHPYHREIPLDKLRCAPQMGLERARLSVGTLGGGNHFIEVNRGKDGRLVLAIHSGSRNLGKQAAEYYQELAFRKLSRDDSGELIARLKAEGREREIDGLLKKKRPKVDKALAYLEGEDFEDYLHDMGLIQRYAVHNRKAIADDIVSAMGLTIVERFVTIHNYIDLERKILRKGAISAEKGEQVIIPINMRDGSLLAVGKGNPEWNFSAPHGAGRLYSRMKAREVFSIEDFKASMEGIWTQSVSRHTLDEAPMAYKPMDEILRNVGETVEVTECLAPVYNFKAAE